MNGTGREQQACSGGVKQWRDPLLSLLPSKWKTANETPQQRSMASSGRRTTLGVAEGARARQMEEEGKKA